MSNIHELLYRMKENINAVEDGDTDILLLSEIRDDFLEFLELVKLFLISERDSYYGYFLMNMQFRVNFSNKSIAGIKLNEFPAVLEANPLLLCKFHIKEILYIICHEIDHVVLNHPAEMVKTNPHKDPDLFYKFNLAADASVNDRINYEIVSEKRKFLFMPDGVVTSSSLADMFQFRHLMPLESYVYYLDKIAGKSKNKKEKCIENGKDSIFPNIAECCDKQSDKNICDDIVTAKNCGTLEDHRWDVGDDAENATAATRELVNAAVDMMSSETRGMMPADFFVQVEKLNEPPRLSWQTILKKYIGTISAEKKKTRLRLNRRQPERFDLSGTMDEKVLKLVVAIDTSASVDDNMIAQIFNEIFAILAKRKHEITVVECDAEVQRVYRATNVSEIKMKIKGRGGTRFSPVIDFVNDDKYFRDALLIYFTDGYGENVIPKPRTYRNIWVVFGNARHLSLKEPYGVVLTL